MEPSPEPGVDGERLLDTARRLSFPRYPGTEGDERAIAFVAEGLRAAGLEVSEEEISYDLRPAWLALRGVLVWAATMMAAASVALPTVPLLAALFVVAAALPPGVFLAWAPWVETLYRRPGPTRTANVVGRRAVEAPRLVLVLMAHHDSKSQSLTLPWRLGFTLGSIFGGLTLTVLVVLSLLTGLAVGRPLALTVGLLTAAALLGLSTLRSGNLSPGAIDNAGSVAILLELARLLPAQLPPDVEAIFLSPGAEEDHMVGALRWLDRHRPERRDCPVYTLNFDGGGNPGRIALLERYGFGRRFSKRLSRLTREVAGRLGMRVRGVLLPPGMGIDAIPFAHRGLESITFSSGSLGPATLAVHSARDRAELIDGETLERVARLGAAVALAVAAADT